MSESQTRLGTRNVWSEQLLFSCLCSKVTYGKCQVSRVKYQMSNAYVDSWSMLNNFWFMSILSKVEPLLRYRAWKDERLLDLARNGNGRAHKLTLQVPYRLV